MERYPNWVCAFLQIMFWRACTLITSYPMSEQICVVNSTTLDFDNFFPNERANLCCKLYNTIWLSLVTLCLDHGMLFHYLTC
jgi:hypothetical protein